MMIVTRSRFSPLLAVLVGWLLVASSGRNGNGNNNDGVVVLALAATTTSTTTRSVVSGKKVVVVGGGPVGIYFAALLRQTDPSATVEVLDRDDDGKGGRRGGGASSSSKPRMATFGLGVGTRMGERLRDVPGLYEAATEVSAPVAALNDIPLVLRDDLVRGMRGFLAGECGNRVFDGVDVEGGRCTLSLGEGFDRVDLSAKTITTSKGRILRYDLLVGADGVNSGIRRALVDGSESAAAAIRERHHTYGIFWKALRIPEQPPSDVHESDWSFRPIRHPIVSGRVLPRSGGGYTLLIFWKGDKHDPSTGNPVGVESPDDWKRLIGEALQLEPIRTNTTTTTTTKSGGSRNPFAKLRAAWRRRKSEKKIAAAAATAAPIDVVVDEATLDDFVGLPGKMTHHLELDRYHHGSVALLGDSAHSFSSFLGQGCATGVFSARTLVDSLLLPQSSSEKEDASSSIEEALERYTEAATVETFAMTDIALLGQGLGGQKRDKLKVLALLAIGKLRGKNLFAQLNDPSIPYSTILKDHKRLFRICRRQYDRQKRPYNDRVGRHRGDDDDDETASSSSSSKRDEKVVVSV